MENQATVTSNVLHFPLLLRENENPCDESPVKTTAVVRVKAPDILTNHTPIHLVLVIDVGSSAAWNASPPAKKPSRLDLLMIATSFILKQLGDGDHLSFVFNDNVTEKFKIGEDSKTDAERKVKRIFARGDTAVKPGLDDAIVILNKDRQDKERLGFILVLSDGLEDSQFRYNDKGSIRAASSGIGSNAVHTFGLLKTHDPRALHDIAKQSNGTYSTITEDLRNKILESLAVCLGGLKSVVAVDTVLNIIAHQQESEPELRSTITKIYSGGYMSGTVQDGTSGDIDVGVLYAGEVRDFVVDFEVHAAPGLKEGHHNRTPPLIVSGQYSKGVAGWDGESIDIPRCAPPLLVYYSRGGAAEEEERSSLLLPFPIVSQQTVRFKVADFMDEFVTVGLEAVKKHAGEGDGLNAQRMAAKDLVTKWGKFKEEDESWMEAERYGCLELGRVDGDIHAMVCCLKRGSGLGCLYSSALSYLTQRAMATGLPANAFLTLAMKEMVWDVHMGQDRFTEVVETRTRGHSRLTSVSIYSNSDDEEDE